MKEFKYEYVVCWMKTAGQKKGKNRYELEKFTSEEEAKERLLTMDNFKWIDNAVYFSTIVCRRIS